MLDAPVHADLAHRDFLKGIWSWKIWLGLGVQDIRIRYKRTILGPWWITASQVATFTCMGMLFSAVLKNDVHTYLPYLAAGMTIWSFLSAVTGDGPQIFIQYHRLITRLSVPQSVHVLRAVTRNFLIFAHNLGAVLVLSLALGGKITLSILFLLVGLPVLFAVAFAAALILAIIGARFRDLGPIIGMAMQFGFFMTPILWRVDDIADGRKWWVMINPAYHLLEMVRQPLLGNPPPALSCAVSMSMALILVLAAYGLFRRYRHRITYWLQPMARITLSNVSVDFPVYDGSQRSLRRALVSIGVGGRILSRGRHVAIRALDGITMDIQDGDRIGLVGGNGAGKTTFLQVLAGLYPPTGGRIRIEGRVATLLGTGCILDPEMTGFENIEHAAILLEIGGSRDKLKDEIAEFSGLGEYLYLPVKTYSAGMQLRLTFALMTAQESDILLIDEVLMVGDAGFVNKANNRILHAAKTNSIVVLASHVDSHIRSLCTKVAWLHQGQLVRFGPVDPVLADYGSGALPPAFQAHLDVMQGLS